MVELNMNSFYPKGLIVCDSDLDFEDGTYEFIEREMLF